MRIFYLKTQEEKEKLFWKKVEKTDTCWLWRGALDRGYGVSALTEVCRSRRAHRIAWIFTKGPIPKGKIICHKCDVKNCVNPDHLYAGTYGDNHVDASNAGGFSDGKPSRFKEGELWLMQRMRDKGLTFAYIAKCFKCSPGAVFYHTTKSSEAIPKHIRG
jgi:hypothetical protein